MKMEVLAVQQPYETTVYGALGTYKAKNWANILTPPPTKATQSPTNLPYLQSNTTNKMKNSIISKKTKRTAEVSSNGKSRAAAAVANQQQQPATDSSYRIGYSNYNHTPDNTNLFYCDDIDATAVNELSLRLLDELRAAKSRHLTCTEVSLPCDLTPRIAAEIIRVSEKEPCGIRGCTIYIEFEDEPNNSRRIASLKLDPEMVSTFEIYLTLRQDHRGWTALLPQFMKSLARTITISPEFSITKHKLYSPQERSSYSYGSNSSSSAAISTPSS
ncbi:protein scylla [Teleopsis dalmanni]|uniref:protein scylla n=1 Tax=Teleopsis dalmanni TaxID=139649 RepID=UPI0018CF36D7|nr:protein scylla [Teleopsis dalmanni]